MKTNLRYVTIFFGCLLAVVIVCSQVYSASSKFIVSTEETSQDSSTTDESQEASFTMATFSLPAPVNVQINLDPHCLFEIVFENVKEEVPHMSLPSVDEKLMVTLFRVIISPNAP